jgi:hypothetical protein
MFANYYLADQKTIIINEKIISTGHLAKGLRGTCHYIIIKYTGQEKQLVYYCGVQVESYKSIVLTIAKGILSYDIVKNSHLKVN